MDNKLALEDIKILNEGQQVKQRLEAKYGSLKSFYEIEAPRDLSLKAIRNYCSYPKVTSDTFKLLLIDKLELGWNELILSETRQLEVYVEHIYSNILLYKDESDIVLLGKVAELCIENKLSNETALMYRCLAKHFYFNNNSKKAIDLYHQAINMLTGEYINTLIILHVELADHLFKERNNIEAEKHYNIAENYTKRSNVSDHAMYMYYYRRGVMLNISEQFEKARDLFGIALKYTRTNTAVISETGAVLMTIGATYAREKKYREAKDFYFKALLDFHENDINGRGAALNNIADIYCKTEDYSNAIRYIEQAIDVFSKEGITSKLMQCSATYAQIKLKVGDESACYNYFSLLKSMVDTSMNKAAIRNSICDMIEVLNSDNLLEGLEQAINYLLLNTTNETYKNELYSCIGRFYIKRKNKEVTV